MSPDAIELPQRQRLVIVGNGMAPGRMLEELLKRAPNAYDVTIFNAEPRVNYDRIMLSPVLSGERAYEDIVIHDEAWYAENQITLHKGRKVTAIDRVGKTVTAADGTIAEYDKLVLATGSAPFIIPVPGKELDGVLGYRDLDDVEKMLGAAAKKGRAVVIGGGLLGLEAAAGLQLQGMDVTVVHLMPTLMERQLDAAAGHLLRRSLEERGIKIITEANTKEILGADGKVRAVLLDDGTELPAELVVMAVGIRPNTGLAADCDLETDRGIIVDDHLATSDPDIFALGECVQHCGVCYGLVAPLYEMAKTLAGGLAGETTSYSGSLTSTKLKVTGINLFSAGDFADGDNREEVVLRDAAAGVYRRLVLEEDKLVGAVLYGDVTDGSWFFDLIKNGADVDEMRDTLIFGQAFAGSTPLDPMVAVAVLPDDAEICGCNGVCKGTILEEIDAQKLTDVEGVRTHTKASASCGTCTGLVEQLLTLSLGDAFSPTDNPALCGCTDLSHGDVRRLIVAKELKTLEDVMQELEWKTSCGCAKCRPALNYYLLSTWPGEYEDDAQSRFVNERLHANIQKDGTYSVVPRMWGGITNANELRAIADVADKFSVPTVKVTGGQRIDLLGIKKEDLPGVWSDLNKAGLVSGHAYGKALRTVKTCVGTDWCRFGTQDSTGFGIRIERFMWGAWTPAKVKMAVSGCPRNCSEATCKDVGVICVDSGYEIHFAGAAGLDIKGTEVLGHATTEDDALEMIVALVQLYREQGYYLERIYKWAKRAGVETIQKTIVEDAGQRAALFDRFVFSQKFSQTDPWAERVQGAEAHAFRPLADLTLEAAE